MSNTTKRYLRESDYKKAILLEHLDQLTQEDQNTLIDAELDAKACIESSLSNEYEIEAEFAYGESINDFNQKLEYFVGDIVTNNGRTNTVNRYKAPQRPIDSEKYWEEIYVEAFDWSKSYNIGEFVSEDNTIYELKYLGYTPSIEETSVDKNYFIEVAVEDYSQYSSYSVGNKVSYGGEIFNCMFANGMSGDSNSQFVVSPIIKQWTQITSTESYPQFSENTAYVVGNRVEYDSLKYECINPTNTKGINQFPDYISFWVAVDHNAWDVSKDYSIEPLEETIVSHNGLSYQLYNKSGLVTGEDPSVATSNWKEVAVPAFDINAVYLRSENSEFDGFVSEGGITYFIYEKNEKFIDFHYDQSDFILTETKDLRNRNIVLHMVNTVLYCLSSVQVPDNVPESRITAYDKTMKWLEEASNMERNPDIPRKTITYEIKNDVTGEVTEITRETSRWALSTSEATRNTWTY